jgi:phosphohistidine swiveling domain-containing protein
MSDTQSRTTGSQSTGLDVGHDPATGAWNDSLAGDFLWSSVNFGEAVPGVMTPFTWSLLQRGALAGWIEFGGFRSFGNIAGRMYLNVSVFASLFHALGRNQQQILDLIEGVVHTSLPEGMHIPLISTPRGSLLALLPMLVRVQWRQRQDLWCLRRVLAANPAWCAQVRARIAGVGTAEELAPLWNDEIMPHLSRVWSGVLSSANHSADYASSLQRDLGKLLGPDDAAALLSSVSAGAGLLSSVSAGAGPELLASLGPVVGVSMVARGEMTRQAFLEQVGHRGEEEFEVSKPRFGEDPAWLDAQLAEWRASPLDAGALLAEQRAAAEVAWRRVRERFPQKAKALRRRIEENARRGRLREATRSEHARVTAIVRDWGLHAGALTGLGLDIFFLSIEEVLDLLGGRGAALPFIPARQDTYARYSALPPYPAVIRGRFDPFRWAADPDRRNDLYSEVPLPASVLRDLASDMLTGAPGSAGRLEGVVRILDSPEEGDQLQPGEILVTAQTNIGWTLLFPRAAAIVTDVGAPLSHAAIVARELGIPAVVGCGDATARLRTGDRVLVDGARGTVRLLAGASGQLP